MQIRLVLSLLLCFFVGSRFAFAEEAKVSPPPKPFLWKIEAPDGKGKPSYVFGTIHLQRPSVATISPTVDAAIAACGVVLTEIKFDVEGMGSLTEAMALPEGDSLSKHLPPDVYKDLKEEFERILPVMGPKMIERMKVWVSGMLLGLLEDQLKNPFGVALDLRISQRGKALDKEIDALETAKEQLSAIEGFTDEEQVAMVRGGIQAVREARKEGKNPVDALVNAYLTGELSSLDAEMESASKYYGPALAAKFIDTLLLRRNRVMAARMHDKMTARPEIGHFFAIGAGHLGGAEGVIQLLEKRGYKLTRVVPAETPEAAPAK